MRRSSRERLYEIIAHSSTDYLSIASSDYKYLAVNETYAKGFNREADKIAGRKIEELLGKDHFERLVKPNFDKCLSEKKVVRFEDWFEVDEARRFFSVSYAPIDIEGEQVVVVNAHDNTRHKVLEESLEQAVEDLREANSFKDKLFSVVSHDVRSPINAINNLLQLLGNDGEDYESIKPILPSMTSKLHSTKTMLDNLLGWASTQIRGEAIEFEEFTLRTIIEENLSLFADEISAKSINVKNDVPETLLIKGDKNGIRMVIRNFFSNAIKFSFEQGDISILKIGSEKDGFQMFSFADNGKGMSQEKCDNLFSGVVHSEKGTQGEVGSGLGLMLVSDSIRAHGGCISVESAEGVGTTFSFSLPVA